MEDRGSEMQTERDGTLQSLDVKSRQELLALWGERL